MLFSALLSHGSYAIHCSIYVFQLQFEKENIAANLDNSMGKTGPFPCIFREGKTIFLFSKSKGTSIKWRFVLRCNLLPVQQLIRVINKRLLNETKKMVYLCSMPALISLRGTDEC
jgi:hypothetical protein